MNSDPRGGDPVIPRDRLRVGPVLLALVTDFVPLLHHIMVVILVRFRGLAAAPVVDLGFWLAALAALVLRRDRWQWVAEGRDVAYHGPVCSSFGRIPRVGGPPAQTAARRGDGRRRSCR